MGWLVVDGDRLRALRWRSQVADGARISPTSTGAIANKLCRGCGALLVHPPLTARSAIFRPILRRFMALLVQLQAPWEVEEWVTRIEMSPLQDSRAMRETLLQQSDNLVHATRQLPTTLEGRTALKLFRRRRPKTAGANPIRDDQQLLLQSSEPWHWKPIRSDRCTPYLAQFASCYHCAAGYHPNICPPACADAGR